MGAVIAAIGVVVLGGVESAWTEWETVYRGTDPAVAYRARLDGELIVIEARHGENWHTYAMDNPLRAKAAGGNIELGLELPTEIAVSGGLEVVGPWHQSDPKDLSDPDIHWYTWGFENISYFAAKVRRSADAPAEISINAQACSENACRMVDRLKLSLAVPSELSPAAEFDLGSLTPVEAESAENQE